MTPEQQKKFQYWQWRTIIGTMIGYSIFYLVRKNFSFAIPGLTVEYGITKATFGAILAIASFIYGVSKLINGFLADRLNGRWHLVTGLSVSAFVNLIFGAGAMICAYLTGVSNGTVFVNALVLLFAILYVINNAFQGCGFPPCNRLITHWVPPQELATKMSIWNTSHSVGAFIAAILCGYIMGHTGTDMSADPEMRARVIENTKNITEGMDPAAAQAYVDNALLNIGAWHWAFWIPAFIAILGVIFIIVTLRDTPKSVGLPELEGTTTVEVKSEEEKKDFRQFIIKKVILSPVIWILSLSVFFVYVVRLAVLDWGPSFLQESRGLSPALSAWTVAIFEAFGVVGMIVAGVVSDKLFHGRAQRTCVLCMVGVILFLILFCVLPQDTNPVILMMVLACIGFFLYGPQALIGVIASNQVTRRGASSANGIIGFVAYLSPLVSGLVFGHIADTSGWELVFKIMIVVAFIGLLTLLTLWNKKTDGYSTPESEN
ncbi:MAG: MFS transporter [Bacteroidales bacterium]|nr:MFS transporter [Bacteroidales bacterium]